MPNYESKSALDLQTRDPQAAPVMGARENAKVSGPEVSAGPDVSVLPELDAHSAAAALRTATTSGQSTLSRYILRIQRQRGNRDVRTVMALARSQPEENEVTPEIESAIERKRGGGQRLDDGPRADMESAFDSDFGSVRVHTDAESGALNRSVNAVAFATGQDIFFGQGAYNPGSTEGRRLLAHELTHVVQQGGGAVQRKMAVGEPGDRFEQEADAVAREVGHELPDVQPGHAATRGTRVRTIEGRAPVGAAQRFDSFEHKEIGDDATKGVHGETKTVELAPDYRVSYGEAVAMGGDYFGGITELRAIAAVPGKGAGTREEIEYVRRVDLPNISDAERTQRTKEFSEAAVQAAEKRYYKLASNNASHFANPEKGDTAKSTLEKGKATHQETEVVFDSINHFTTKLKTLPNNAAGYYRMNHLQAIGEAVAAGKAKTGIDGAMAANAFSDHFLTDSFSAGHNRTARTSATQYWNDKEPMFFVNFKGFLAEKLAYYINDHNIRGIATVDYLNDKATEALEATLAKKGTPDFHFGDLVAGAIHDYDNQNGIAVTVDGADKKIFGDDHLGKGDTKDVAVRAVQASVADVEAAYEAGKAGETYDVLYSRIAPRGLFRSEEMMPMVKADAELAPADRSIKWDYPDVGGLIGDPKFREGLKIFMAAKKSELASVGQTLDADYKREAFENAIVKHMQGDEGIGMIWSILQWTPNTGGGVGGHNQDDNALAYFYKAKKASGGLASLMWSARANLIKNLVDGYTSGEEENAIFELLTSCSNDSDLHNVIDFITWDRLEDEVGDRFSKRYTKAQYGKKAP